MILSVSGRGAGILSRATIGADRRPPMAAIANAIERPTGKRLTELPMSPPKVLTAIDGE